MRTWRNMVVRFGLLSVPVALSPLVGKPKDTEGHTFTKDGERVRRAWTVDGTKIVPDEDTETRFERPDGDPVALEIAISGETGIDIEAALHIGDVDASLFDSSYACNPTKDGAKSLATLLSVLRDSGRVLVGRARFTESASAKSVVLRYSPLTKGIVLETLAPLERVRIEAARKIVAELPTPSASEIKQGASFVDSLPDVLPALVVVDERDEAIRGALAALTDGLVPALTPSDIPEDADADMVADFVRSGYEAAKARKDAETEALA